MVAPGALWPTNSTRSRCAALAGRCGTTARRSTWASNLPFRALALVTVTVVANLASQRYPLPYVSADVGLACFLLVVMAILFIGTEEADPGEPFALVERRRRFRTGLFPPLPAGYADSRPYRSRFGSRPL